ncbi:hypothetical protein D3C77_496670 [compost metagenome]
MQGIFDLREASLRRLAVKHNSTGERGKIKDGRLCYYQYKITIKKDSFSMFGLRSGSHGYAALYTCDAELCGKTLRRRGRRENCREKSKCVAGLIGGNDCD